jgi:uncharacterized protein YdcH (DUF465 family)
LPFQFTKLANNNAFFDKLAESYREIEDKQLNVDEQIWHTPTELFQPWFIGYNAGMGLL